MKQSVDIRVRSVFIIKQRHGLSCNKRLCSPLLETQRVKGGQRSDRALEEVIWGIQHIVEMTAS